MKLRFRVISSLILFIAFGGLLSRCGDKKEGAEEVAEASPYLNHHDSVDYVGMKVCMGCHADKHATFIHTGMGQSFDSATRAKSAADFHQVSPVYDAHSDLYYYPFWKEQSLYIKEYRLEGKDTLYSRLERVDYIVGSGQHTNSHILERNGYLFQAPLTWYAQEKRWDLPPGFEGGNNSRFSRLIGMECMSCHNGLPRFDERSINRFVKIPDGIDCERCHGPGEAHVALKKQGILVDVSKETDYSIVNPAKLPWELQVDVCQRCHLQGNAVLKEGKHWEDFRPGMKLNLFMDIFMPRYEGGEDEFIMASHAQRLQMSNCFLKGNTEEKNKQLTCITCHNPHVSVKVTGKEVFNESCRGCHQEQKCSVSPALLEKEKNNCVKCHMPANRPVDIPHVTVHDHYIRKPGEYKPLDPEVKKFIGLYAINNPNPDAQSRSLAYLAQFEKFEARKEYLDSAEYWMKKAGNPTESRVHLLFLRKDYAGIIRDFRTYAGEDAWANYRIGRAFRLQNQPVQAIPFLEKASRKLSRDPDMRSEWAASLLENKQLSEAKLLLDEVLIWNEKHVSALTNRGFICFLEGNKSGAREYYEKALAADPDAESALLNMAGLYLSLQQKEKALVYINRILKKNPEHTQARNIKNQLRRS